MRRKLNTYDLTGGQFETELELFPTDATIETVRYILNDQYVCVNVQNQLIEILP